MFHSGFLGVLLLIIHHLDQVTSAPKFFVVPKKCNYPLGLIEQKWSLHVCRLQAWLPDGDKADFDAAIQRLRDAVQHREGVSFVAAIFQTADHRCGGEKGVGLTGMGGFQ